MIAANQEQYRLAIHPFDYDGFDRSCNRQIKKRAKIGYRLDTGGRDASQRFARQRPLTGRE